MHQTYRKPRSLLGPGTLRGRAGPRATLPRVHWLFTGLLVGVSGATAVYTLWLVRRLFTTRPPPHP